MTNAQAVYEPTGESEGERSNSRLLDDAPREYSLPYRLIKRSFDILASGTALVLLSPLLAVLCLLIRLDSKGPALFVHKRVGKNGKPLNILKFRTMYTNAQEMLANFTPEQKKEWEENFKLEDDPRITSIGKILRKTSLDELPQLLNILRGEMSVVGPRPVVEEELKKYGIYQEKFLSATPGLTGYWQAYARSDCSYQQRMEMELKYVQDANLWWDIKILFATVSAVLKGKGAR